MYMVLPEWNGWAVGTMHRIGLTINALAAESGVRRQYVSRILNSKRNTDSAMEKIDSAIRSFCEARGIDYEEIRRPFEEGRSQGTDT